jgi:hypothetical protein
MTPERLDELIQKYVLGRPTESETAELSHHLEQDGAMESRRKLRLALKADAYLEEAAAELGMAANLDEPPSTGPSPSLRLRLWTMAGLAAAIVVGVFAWFHNPATPRTGSDPGVATVLRVEGKGQLSGNRALHSGETILAGDQLTMTEGLVEMVFRKSGVHVIATAPLSFTAQNSMRLALQLGEVKVHVPPQGIGFVVKSTEREITDLGTRFVVTAWENESQVLVLEGLIEVEDKDGGPGVLMTTGEVASWSKGSKLQLLSKKTMGMPELAPPTVTPGRPSLPGMIYGFENKDLPQEPLVRDLLGWRLAPLIRSGFQDRDCLEGLQSGRALHFTGLAGGYAHFAERHGIGSEAVSKAGWLTWYSGRLTPPRPGRYRFLGYADNSLLVAIDGKPVFDGSRYDSAIREIVEVPRQDHPAWPCLDSAAGFAVGPWISLGEDPVQVDLLFGEKHGNRTYGLLLVEREGEHYETTVWGQPKWPLFLTGEPGESERRELNRVRVHMENKLMGSFSISSEAIWNVEE